MTRKQKLRNAVILGLFMSSITGSNAWADVVLVEGKWYPEGLRIQGVTERYNGVGKDITIQGHNDGIWLGASLGIWAVGTHVADASATIDVGSLDISVRNYIGDDATVKDEISAGLLAGAERVDSSFQGDANHKANLTVNAANSIKISSLTRNGADAYGVYSKKNGNIDVNSQNGNIVINSSKGLSTYVYDDNMLIHKYEIKDADYANSKAAGIATVDGGKVSIDAANGNIGINAYIEDVSDLSGYKNFDKYNEQLQKSDIYGISNVNGTVDLTAGGSIFVAAEANKGDAYGIYGGANLHKQARATLLKL